MVIIKEFSDMLILLYLVYIYIYIYFNKFILLEFAIFTIKQRLAKDFITRGFHRTLIPTCIFMISFKSNIYSERVSNLTVHVLITTAKYAF